MQTRIAHGAGGQFMYPGQCGEREQPGRLRFYGRWGRGSGQLAGALGRFFFSKPRDCAWVSKKFRFEILGYLKKDETDAFWPGWGTRSSRSACKSSRRNRVKERPRGEGRWGSILARAAGFNFLDAEKPGWQACGVLQESCWRGASPARSDAEVRVTGGTRPRPLWQSPAAVWPAETSTRTQQPAALMAHKRGLPPRRVRAGMSPSTSTLTLSPTNSKARVILTAWEEEES